MCFYSGPASTATASRPQSAQVSATPAARNPSLATTTSLPTPAVRGDSSPTVAAGLTDADSSSRYMNSMPSVLTDFDEFKKDRDARTPAPEPEPEPKKRKRTVLTNDDVDLSHLPTSQWQRGLKTEDRNPMYREGDGARAVEQLVDKELWRKYIGADHSAKSGMFNGWSLEDRPSVSEFQQLKGVSGPGASSAKQHVGPGTDALGDRRRAEALIREARRGMRPARRRGRREERADA